MEAKKNLTVVLMGIFFVMLYCLSSAASVVLIDKSFDSLEPLHVVFLSFLMSMIVFVALNLKNTDYIKTMIKQDLALVVKLNVATGVMWIATFYGIKFLNPSITTALFFGLLPVMTLLLTFRKKSAKVVKMEIIVCSLILVILFGLAARYYFVADVNSSLIWAYLAVGSFAGISAAFTNIYAHRMAGRGYTATQVLSIRFVLLIIISGIILFKFNISSSNLSGSNVHGSLHHMHLLLIALISLTSVILPLYFLQRGLERIGPSFVAFILPFVPIFVYGIELVSGRTEISWVKLMLLLSLGLVVVSAGVVKMRGVE